MDKVNGGYELIDYKMSKSIPSQKEIEDSLQLNIYPAGFYKLTKIIPLRAGFYYLRHRKKFFVTPTEENIHDTIKLIYSIADKIGEGRFLAKRGPFCGVCDYRDKCSLITSESGENSPRIKQLRFTFKIT